MQVDHFQNHKIEYDETTYTVYNRDGGIMATAFGFRPGETTLEFARNAIAAGFNDGTSRRQVIRTATGNSIHDVRADSVRLSRPSSP